jgi:molybdopterin-binding protein
LRGGRIWRRNCFIGYWFGDQSEGPVKISARNSLKGTVIEIVTGSTTSHIRIDVLGNVVTASITNEAVADLGLKEGQEVYAIVKASDVMVAVP